MSERTIKSEVGTAEMGVHVPGTVRYLRHRYREKPEDTVELVAQSFNVKEEVALAILTGAIDYDDDGNSISFDWPDGEEIRPACEPASEPLVQAGLLEVNQAALTFMAALVGAVVQLKQEVGRTYTMLDMGGWQGYDYAEKIDSLLDAADAIDVEVYKQQQDT